jgi:hypothetical protein
VGLHSGVAGDLDEPDRFDLAVGELRGDHTDTGERGSCGVLSVDCVALAGHAPGAGPGWTRDLNRRVAVAAQEPGQTNAIGATALDREDMDLAERTRPGEELGVAIIVGVEELRFVDEPADAVDGDGDVLVLVGVDADDDVAAIERDAGHDC